MRQDGTSGFAENYSQSLHNDRRGKIETLKPAGPKGCRRQAATHVDSKSFSQKDALAPAPHGAARGSKCAEAARGPSPPRRSDAAGGNSGSP